MMQHDELPLVDAIDEAHFEEAFQEHGIDFGNDDDAVYTPAITLWALLCAVIGVTEELSALGQAVSSSERVGHRYGRVEPRKNKRRPKLIALMTKPRHQYHAELKAAA